MTTDDITPTPTKQPPSSAGRGLASMFGLHPSAAALAVVVDLMATSASIISMGLLVQMELVAAVALVFIVYKIQRHWHRDDGTSAGIKAAIIGLLTAIPVASTPFIIAYAIGGTILGFTRKKKTDDVIDVEFKEASDSK